MASESNEDDGRIQAFISFLVGFLVVVVLIPVWWNTTTVYRAPLPQSEIFSLQDTKTTILVTTTFYIEKGFAELNDPTLTVGNISKQLNSALDFYAGNINYNVTVSAIFPFSKSEIDLSLVSDVVVDTPSLERRLQKFHHKLNSTSNSFGDQDKLSFTFFIYLAVKPKSDDGDSCTSKYGLTNHVFISHYEHNSSKILACLQQSLASLLPNRTVITDKTPRIITDKSGKILENRGIQHSQGIQLSFVLANPDPDHIVASWNIQEELDCSFKPLLSDIASLGPYRINSQILYYTDLGKQPRKRKDGFHYDKKNLPLLLNKLESRLESYTSTVPTLYFVIYVTPFAQIPLHIKTGKETFGSSFLSPRWGGIYFYNAKISNVSNSMSVHHNIQMGAALNTFKEQLKMLLGFQNQMGAVKRINHQLSKLDVSLMILQKTIKNLDLAVETLNALSKLVLDIKNLVIGDDIKELVGIAMGNVTQTRTLVSSGLYREAYLASRQAVSAAEKAFFDPSLLELLYFPDDQKYAIYVPLFLPASVPLLSSLFKALKYYRKKNQ